MARTFVHPSFRRVFGDAFSDFLEDVAAGTNKSSIGSAEADRREWEREQERKAACEARARQAAEDEARRFPDP